VYFLYLIIAFDMTASYSVSALLARKLLF